MYLVVFGRLFLRFLSISLQSGCLLLLVICHFFIESFLSVFSLSGSAIRSDLWHRLRVAAVSVLPYSWFCWSFGGVSCFLSCSRIVVLPAIFLLFTPSPLYVLDIAPLRTFIPACVSLWNKVDESDIAGDGLGASKTSVNRFLMTGVHYTAPY